MKQIFTLVIAMAITTASFAQSVSPTSTFSATNGGSGSSWNFSNTTRNWTSNVSNSSQSEYLNSNSFDLSSIPNSATLTSITVTFTRNSSGSNMIDSAIRFRIGGVIMYGSGAFTSANTRATATNNAWPTTATSTTYTFPADVVSSLNLATLKSSGLSIAVKAWNASGSNRTATIGSSVSMTVSFLTLAPIILTDFTVAKNADNQVDIRFATASEENVKYIYVERSANGQDFQPLFTITPKGARNVYTKYNMVDRTPLQGNNYYRISEMDKDGRMHYYITKLVNITGNAGSFNAYYNGGQVVANISNAPGLYEVSIIDMSGVTVTRKQVNMTGKSAQLTLDAPARAGIYVVILKGQGVSESTRVAIVK